MKKTHILQIASGVLVLIPVLATAQRPPRPKPTLVPFFQVDKAAGFTVVRPSKQTFLEMQALTAAITKDVAPKVGANKKAVQLEYGYKKGGVVMIYEAQKIPGMTSMQLFEGMMKTGVFRDHQYFKGWTMFEVSDKNLLIAVSATSDDVKKAVLKALGK